MHQNLPYKKGTFAMHGNGPHLKYLGHRVSFLSKFFCDMTQYCTTPMDDLLKELSNKLIEFKYTFAETNNRLLVKFESLNSRHKDSPELLRPYVSNSVRDILNSQLVVMQETAVNSIGICFKKFYIHAVENQQMKHTFSSKRFDKDVIETLEASFRNSPYPSEKEKTRIQEHHGITHRQVSNWFTNKRNRSRTPPRTKVSHESIGDTVSDSESEEKRSC